MRILAIDYGDQRIGLATSDLMGMIVGDAWTLTEWNMEKAVSVISQEIKARNVEKIVLGFPKNMDGTEGPRCEKTRQFAAMLKESTGMDPVFWDERRSSIEAHAILHSVGKKEKNHRKSVDAVAASLILEGFLNSPLNV